MVIHTNGGTVSMIACTACCTADLTGSYFLHDQMQDIRIIHRQNHGIQTPVLIPGITRIDRNGVCFLQTCRYSGCKRDHAA